MGSALSAQRSAPHIDPGARKLMRSPDFTFALRAYQSGLAEIQFGQLAAQKAADASIKSFAQRMVQEHSKASEELKAIVEKDAMTLPTELSAKDQSELNKLDGLSEAEFTKHYVSYMAKSHAEDIKEYRKEVKDGKEEQIKGFADRMLLVLEAHLNALKAMENSSK